MQAYAMRGLRHERRVRELELLNRHARALNAEGGDSAASQSDWDAEWTAVPSVDPPREEPADSLYWEVFCGEAARVEGGAPGGVERRLSAGMLPRARGKLCRFSLSTQDL